MLNIIGNTIPSNEGSAFDTGWVNFDSLSFTSEDVGVVWIDPQNAYLDDSTYARITLTTANPTSQGLKGVNAPDLQAIPGGAEILGIMLRVDGISASGLAHDNQISLAVAGNTIGDDRSKPGNWDNNGYTEYGSPSDLWGVAWSSTAIKAASFGAQVGAITDAESSIVLIDHIQIKVFYKA